jgi:hypothetical protein
MLAIDEGFHLENWDDTFRMPSRHFELKDLGVKGMKKLAKAIKEGCGFRFVKWTDGKFFQNTFDSKLISVIQRKVPSASSHLSTYKFLLLLGQKEKPFVRLEIC